MKTILIDAVNTFVVNGEIFREMYELLEKYPNNKIILTNADDTQIESFGLVNLPYELFTLKHNPNKTDPAYFLKMFESLRLTKESVLYFEHNIEAVKSAQSVGIMTYHYQKDEKGLIALQKFLDENLS
jgi:FMN phosphatase YigB (HAD superfamily)